MFLQLHRDGQFTYPLFPAILFTSTLHNILSKPLAAFPHNYRWNNEQRRERKELCCNDYDQSSERILAEPGIEPVTFCSQVLCDMEVYAQCMLCEKVLNPSLHRYSFWCINNRQLMITLWEKKKLLTMSNFFFSRNVFYLIRYCYPICPYFWHHIFICCWIVRAQNWHMR